MDKRGLTLRTIMLLLLSTVILIFIIFKTRELLGGILK